MRRLWHSLPLAFLAASADRRGLRPRETELAPSFLPLASTAREPLGLLDVADLEDSSLDSSYNVINNPTNHDDGPYQPLLIKLGQGAESITVGQQSPHEIITRAACQQASRSGAAEVLVIVGSRAEDMAVHGVLYPDTPLPLVGPAPRLIC